MLRLRLHEEMEIQPEKKRNTQNRKRGVKRGKLRNEGGEDKKWGKGIIRTKEQNRARKGREWKMARNTLLAFM